MKIAIPTDGESGFEDEIAFHFGRVRNYFIYNTEDKEYKFLTNTSEHMGGKGLPPELLKKEGVGILLCGDLGSRALELFKEFNIEVYCGGKGRMKEVIEDYQKGKLEKANMNNICQH